MDYPSGSGADLDTPFTLQCATCLRVLGDSLSFIVVIPEMKLIVLNNATNVSLSKDLSVSQIGYDKGSTFHAVHCSGCNTRVGCVYRTSPPKLDAARDAYSFDEGTVLSYQLGSGAPAKSGMIPGIADFLQRLSGSEETISTLQESVDYLYSQLERVQEIVLGLSETVYNEEAPTASGETTRVTQNEHTKSLQKRSKQSRRDLKQAQIKHTSTHKKRQTPPKRISTRLADDDDLLHDTETFSPDSSESEEDLVGSTPSPRKARKVSSSGGLASLLSSPSTAKRRIQPTSISKS